MIECDNNEEFIIANLSSTVFNETLDLPLIEGEVQRLVEDCGAEVGDDELLVVVALDHQGGNRLSCSRHLKARLRDPERFLHLSFISFARFNHQAPEDVATARLHLHCCQVLFV